MSGHIIQPDIIHEFLCLERGEGIYVYDKAGRKYMDAAAGVGVMALGYARKELADVLADQAMTIPYVHAMRFANQPSNDLANQIAEFAPEPLNWSFFASGGSEAMESALKIARQYFLQRGKPEKSRFIGRWQSFHGNTIATQSVGGHLGRRAPHQPMLINWPHIPPAYCYRCPFGLSYPNCDIQCAQALEREICWQGPETIAAFVAEPIVGAAGGATVPAPEYFPLVRQICDKYDVLFIADEVITGFGRTGKNFGIEHFGVTPDMIVTAKGISSGYAPLGALIVSDPVMAAFQTGSGKVDHNFTFAGNPLACRVGSEVLRLIEKEKLVEKAAARGKQLFAGLENFYRFPFVGDVRGKGLLAGIELVQNKEKKTPFPLEFHAYQKINELALDEGLIVYPGGGTADGYIGDHFLLMPPLIISEEEVDQLLTLLERVLTRFGALV
ncbi:MAG: aspartate aminotransferase family protein [Chloroflexi bacterium]|nr:aspartate aminotransferase family protein [Chloroflexota bacterium]